MKRLSILVLLTIVVCAGLADAAEKKGASGAPPLTVSENVWLYGFIPKDSWVSHHFVLTNPHAEPVTILTLTPGCDCTHVPRGPVTIPPGKTYLLKVLFDTRTYFDETNRDVHIVTDYRPSPEMDIYFGSIASRSPTTVSVTPPSTAFIPGKSSQEFIIKNLSDETSHFRVFIDNDSTLTVAPDFLTLNAQGEGRIVVTPRWDLFPVGPTYSCLVVEVARKQPFRFTIPIKINKF